MRKSRGTPFRQGKYVTLAAMSRPGVARGRIVGSHQSGLTGCKSPPLFTPGSSSVRAVICSHQGCEVVGSWFKTKCKHMGIRHAKIVAYHSGSNSPAEVARRQMFEKFCQLHIEEPERSLFHSLWTISQAFHDLPGPTGASVHRLVFLRDRVSQTLPWTKLGKVARDADAMMSEADATVTKVCNP